MTRIAKLCLARMMVIQIASKQSYFNTTWGKDYSHLRFAVGLHRLAEGIPLL